MKHKWYIIHTNAGAERIVKEMILEKAKKMNICDMFNDIVIPSVQVPSIKKGKKIKVEKKLMPNYVFINMNMNDESWRLVTSIPKITGFLGNTMPKAIPENEVIKIIDSLKEKEVELSTYINFEIGERIKVIDGPFDSFTGIIEEIDNERSKMKVSITIFGRSTPVELNFNQVTKN